jgi:hypothetical protein
VTDPVRNPLHLLPADSGCVIDCDTCAVRGDACADCVVSVMLGGPPDVVPPDEARALDVLAGAGLVPPLRATVPGPAAPPALPGPAAPAGPPGPAAPPGRGTVPAGAPQPSPTGRAGPPAPGPASGSSPPGRRTR